jgi:uncharacterized protein YigE (DUF2233 family)
LSLFFPVPIYGVICFLSNKLPPLLHLFFELAIGLFADRDNFSSILTAFMSSKSTFLISRAGLFAWAGWCGLTALVARANDAAPAGLQAVTFRGQSFWIRTVDPGKEDLRLFWKDDQGKPLHDFPPLALMITAHDPNARLGFAANAGMFEADLRPVGLLVQDGKEESPLNLNDGDGNFYMKPNGVFLINQKHKAMVVEASAYTALLTPVIWATQSGPLLVQDGDIHPDFIEGSANKKLRSGVGVRKDGTIVFAISRGPVNFYDFAYFFLHPMNCLNALYLDGEISAFYVPGMKSNAPHQFGPMFGLIKNGVVPFTKE